MEKYGKTVHIWQEERKRTEEFPIHLTRQTIGADCMLHTGMHWHDNIEFIYVVSGTAQIICGLERIDAAPSDLISIFPGELHCIIPGGESVEYYGIGADLNFFRDAGLFVEYARLPRLTSPAMDARPGKLAFQLIQEIQEHKTGFKAMACTLMIQMAICLIRDDQNTSGKIYRDNRKIRMIKDALEYMAQNYTHEISVDAICEHIGFSKYYFCRTFKQITGKTAVEHLNMIRCQKAYELIAQNKYSIKQAALAAGFHNQQYFCKVYKKYTGTLPSQIKKQRAAG